MHTTHRHDHHHHGHHREHHRHPHRQPRRWLVLIIPIPYLVFSNIITRVHVVDVGVDVATVIGSTVNDTDTDINTIHDNTNFGIEQNNGDERTVLTMDDMPSFVLDEQQQQQQQQRDHEKPTSSNNTDDFSKTTIHFKQPNHHRPGDADTDRRGGGGGGHNLQQHRHRHRRGRGHGRLYYCGWDTSPQYMFPEYDYQGLWRPHLEQNQPEQHHHQQRAQNVSTYDTNTTAATATTANEANGFTLDHGRDILVIGLYGPCLGQRRFKISHIRELILDRNWFHNGKILVVNGEAYGEILDPNVLYGYHRHYDRSTVMDNSTRAMRTQVYQIGPYMPPSQYHNHSLPVSFMTIYFGFLTMLEEEKDKSQYQKVNSFKNFKNGISSSTSPIWDVLSGTVPRPGRTRDSTDRRRNLTVEQRQGPHQHYHEGVAYFASKCIRFRQQAAKRISTILNVYHGKGCKPPSPPISSSKNSTISNNNNNIILLLDDHEKHPEDDNENKKRNNSNIGSLDDGGSDDRGRDSWQHNYKLYSRFKYCLVMENTAKDGYITEKLLNAFLGGCLPIYYGSRFVLEIFHQDSFVFYDINNPQPALDQIRYFESQPEAYDAAMRAPILNDGPTTLETYFSIFPTIGNGTVNKRIRTMMGIARDTIESRDE